MLVPFSYQLYNYLFTMVKKRKKSVLEYKQ